ncbi:peptidyl-tRNA hydrolase [Haloechinothrix halophila]|uniref:peptidyl-tRNA hydrolase n=1 Tax=Haloechinothrix halophila TaxID=1069073 RepID=UPI0006883A33|nr:peptidyl-tRNA hydrolase [Haloechinothrix halophila]
MPGGVSAHGGADADVLAPLAARYAAWHGLPAHAVADVRDEDPDDVRAMPVVLRLERDPVPSRTPLLETAAAAAVAVCLDPRAEPGGEWHDAVAAWVSGRIRKVARRARGAHWRAVQDLPGVTVAVGGAEVRALLPCRVSELPKTVSRLQISGSDLPADEPGPPPHGLPVLWLNPDVAMTVGKAAAQVGHATMLLAAVLDTEQRAAWVRDGFRCAVRTPPAERWTSMLPDDPAAAWRDRGMISVRDAGFTEVDPGTITVLAEAP